MSEINVHDFLNPPMKYDIYFAGSSYASVMKKGEELNVCKLFTQLTERKSINEWAELKRSGEFTGKLMMDSGAFSAHTRGANVDVDEYISYINTLGDGITLAIQVDHIPGKFGVPRTKEQVLEAPRKSWDNYLYMRDKVNDPDKILPVFHQDEDFKWLRNMLDFRDPDGKQLQYICISSAKDKHTNLRESWYYKVFSIIHASSNPDIKTHSLGTSSINHMQRFPFTSSDATSWIQLAALGYIITDIDNLLVSGQTKQSSSGDNNALLIPEKRRYLEDLAPKYGLTIQQIQDSSEYRQQWNMLYYIKWSQNYEYIGPKVFKQKSLF
jgi:hypothetical protein